MSRRLKLLQNRYGREATFWQVADKEEVEDILGVALELRNHLRNLQWYGEVNRRGFTKILKKKDKKIPSSKTQQQYLRQRVDPRPFASNAQLNRDLNVINTWLSKLTELKSREDWSESESTSSYSRSATPNAPNLPKELLDEIDKALKEDSCINLADALNKVHEYWSPESSSAQNLFSHLLQRAISSVGKQCIPLLLNRIISLDTVGDINKRNCLHRVIISVARSRKQRNEEEQNRVDQQNYEADTILPAEAPNLQTSAFAMKSLQNELDLVDSDQSVQIFQLLLDSFTTRQQQALSARDLLGRMPLHYAAQYGFPVFCQMIVARMREWHQLDTSKSLDTEEYHDSEGNSPLHLSVFGGHIETTRCLLDKYSSHDMFNGESKPTSTLMASISLLKIAAKANFSDIISLLVAAGADVNALDRDGESAMHSAARYGHSESAKALLINSHKQVINLNIQERVYGWSPIHVASVDGQLSMVQVLADAGADIVLQDFSSWTAKEHAALRGHLDIAQLLATKEVDHNQLSESITNSSSSSQGSSLAERTSTAQIRDRSPPGTSDPIKSFGHRYLRDDSIILVSLGSMDQRKECKPVSLDNIPLKDAHTTQLDTALSVVVSATGAKSNEPTVIDLPVKENISTDPVVFTAKDMSKVKLLFDIVPTYSGSKEQVVGRGVALLSTIKPNIGSKRMNLQGDVSVPIIASKTMDYIGTVNFNFLVITPFDHPSMEVSEHQTYWKSLTGPMVIGHRGMGKNMAARKSLQLGENTIQSFIAAANLGASYVEFDVQLTKDHVPVIYHDFLVSETGIDAPVHTLTLEQFLHVNETQSSRQSRSSSPTDSYVPADGTTKDPRKRMQRAHSLGAKGTTPNSDMEDRMRHTRDFKLKGYKGNSRGNFIQAPFTTLEEMLLKLPKTIGFNIEMKYPMLFESEEQEMDTYAVELNSFVDTVLKMVYDHGQERDIIFSSFNPDICLLLSFKQPSIPILFLTDAGASPVGDIRASSLQEAIRFASRWNLLGVVSAAEPLVTCPRLVRVVKESGLVCVSYGTLNNDAKNVKRQVDEGIDAVIVDSVLAIRQGLTHGTPTTTPANGRASADAVTAMEQ